MTVAAELLFDLLCLLALRQQRASASHLVVYRTSGSALSNEVAEVFLAP